MRKKILREVEVDVCSNCGKEDGMSFECFACNFVACWDCSDKSEVMVKYSHGVYHHGGKDGWYCATCDMRLSEDRSDPLHNSYTKVRSLRETLKHWSESFERSRKVAEAEAERLFDDFDAKRKAGQ